MWTALTVFFHTAKDKGSHKQAFLIWMFAHYLYQSVIVSTQGHLFVPRPINKEPIQLVPCPRMKGLGVLDVCPSVSVMRKNTTDHIKNNTLLHSELAESVKSLKSSFEKQIILEMYVTPLKSCRNWLRLKGLFSFPLKLWACSKDFLAVT